jgi:hypothetical protein|tara:strand:+ start:250 stop:435 length:186 start_codon:yes stop_codon:yes gene_type:complete
MEWITENIGNVFDILSKLIAAAAAIAALTSTPKDDGILMKVRKIIDMFALNILNAKNSDEE